MKSRNAILAGVLATTLTAAAGCASVATSPAASGAPMQPLVVGWEQYFRLTWQAELRHGAPVIWGRIFNDGGFPAIYVRLLVEGLDPAGTVTEQKVGWLSMALSPGTTAPFEVPLARVAAQYRVSVFAFDWEQKEL